MINSQNSDRVFQLMGLIPLLLFETDYHFDVKTILSLFPVKWVILLNVFKKQFKRTSSRICTFYLNTTFPSPLHHSQVSPTPCDSVRSPSPMHLLLETAINYNKSITLQFHHMPEHFLPFHPPFCMFGAIHAFY